MEAHVGMCDATLDFANKLIFTEPIKRLLMAVTEDAHVLLVELSKSLAMYYVVREYGKFSIEKLCAFDVEGRFVCFDESSQLFVVHSKSSSSLKLYETVSGNIVSTNTHALLTTLSSAAFLKPYPHILAAIHSDKILSLWDMRDITFVLQTALEEPPKEILNGEDSNYIIITTTNARVEVFAFEMSEDQIIVTKEFAVSPQIVNVGSSVLLEGRNQVVLVDKAGSVSIVDLSSRLVAAKIPLTVPISDSLYNLIDNKDGKFTVVLITESRLLKNTYELSCIEETKEDVQSFLSPEEELDIEQFIAKSEPSTDTLLNKAKAQTKKRWQCQATVNMLEQSAPRPNSILIPANIQIKEKTIYDVNAKEMSKLSRKDPGKNLAVSNLALRVDYPVTFHTKIKSSGYGKAPEALKYTAGAKKKKLQKSVPKPVSKKTSIYSQGYPINFAVSFVLMAKAVMDTMKSPIVCVQYSNSGEVIAAGTQHGNVELLYLGAKTETVPLKIHTSGINSLAFSSSDKYLLTSSSDKSASMWKVLGNNRGNLLLQLKQEYTNIESLASQKKEQAKSFAKEVRKASFYYQDLLIALASENVLRFYSYEIVDPKLKDDVKRLQSKVRYKEVQRYTLRDVQSITTFAVHNRVKSHYALVVGSNKSLHLYNVNMCEQVFSLDESQGRTIHTAKFFEGSDFVGSQGSEYNIFGTASLDSTIKVWDVRQSGAVRSYSDHANRMVHVGFDFSPCMRYVVSGSEDRNFVVYDMRVDGKYVWLSQRQ